MSARVHIFTATALGRVRVANPPIGRLYPRKVPVLILQEAEWTPGPVRTRMREETRPSAAQDRTRVVQRIVKRLIAWLPGS